MTLEVVPDLADRHVVAVFRRGEVASDDWWQDYHQARLHDVPNLISAQRFAIAETKPLPGTNPLDYGEAVLYEVDGDSVEPLRVLSELWADTDQHEPGSLTVMAFRPISRVHVAPQFDPATSFADRHLLLVWVDRPEETGEAATFDDWYDDTHIRDFLSAPGVFRAQRFLPTPVGEFADAIEAQHGHLALYEVDGDLLPVREEIKNQLMSGQMVLPEFVPPPFDSMFLRPASVYAPLTSHSAVSM